MRHKIVLDHALAASCDDDKLLDLIEIVAVDDVVDRGFVADRDHAFGECFGEREHTCPKASDRNNCFHVI